jgi:hypothetical protein
MMVMTVMMMMTTMKLCDVSTSPMDDLFYTSYIRRQVAVANTAKQAAARRGDGSKMAADGSSTSSQRRLSLSTLFIEACDVAVTHRYMFMLQLAGEMLHCYNLCNDVT